MKLKKNKDILQKKGRIPLPSKLIFEPTLNCNLSCSMCERSRIGLGGGKNELTLVEIRKLIDRLPASIKEVYISGGEPLMRTDIKDLCKLFQEKNISIMIQTNGTYPQAVSELSDVGIEFNFSLDGTMQVHNRIRGNSTVYSKVMQCIKYVKAKGRPFSITTVITDENINDLHKLIEMLHNKGLKPDFIILELARRFTKGMIDQTIEELELSKGDIPLHTKKNAIPSYSYDFFKDNIQKLDKQLRKYGFKYCYYHENLLRDSSQFYHRRYRENNELYCDHLDVLRIDSRANVIPCFVVRKSFGNILERPINEIWNSKEFCEFRTKLVENNLAPVCDNCFRARNGQNMDSGIIFCFYDFFKKRFRF